MDDIWLNNILYYQYTKIFFDVLVDHGIQEAELNPGLISMRARLSNSLHNSLHNSIDIELRGRSL